MPIDKRAFVLHGHWLTADAVKHAVGAEIAVPRNPPLPKDIEEIGQLYSMFMRLEVWYALLYVVVEGYRESGMSDETVDSLLGNEDLVDKLKRFRNAVFHWQNNPMPPKRWDFLLEEGSAGWIHELHAAFKRMLENSLPISEWQQMVTTERDA